MSKYEILHELYNECKNINFNESHELLSNAKTEEEAEFIRVVTDVILQQKQKQVISEKRF